MKIVITGGPSSGKTTIIDALKERGYNVISESARDVIVDKGYSKFLDRYEGEALDLQTDILREQIRREKEMDNMKGIVFLDRGYIDSHAYCRHLLGYIPKKLQRADVLPYDKVILLERLSFIDDGLRRETEHDAQKLHDLILAEYRKAGYEPILLPATSIADRIRQIEKIARERLPRDSNSMLEECSYLSLKGSYPFSKR